MTRTPEEQARKDKIKAEALRIAAFIDETDFDAADVVLFSELFSLWGKFIVAKSLSHVEKES